jgi:hypothetical protein
MKVETDIIANTAVSPIGRDVIMFVETSKTDVIVFIGKVIMCLTNCRYSILMTVSMYNVMIFAQLYTIVSATKMYK